MFTAIEYALLLLKYKNRTEKEISGKLKRKNFTETAIRETIEKLKRLKLLDDEKFARTFIETKLGSGRGINRIILELKNKGVSTQNLDETLKEYGDTQEQQFETACRLFENKTRTYSKLPPEKIYRRTGGFLSRRGFSSDIIRKVFNEWEKEKTKR
ncbi:MAG: regulatory protein RecX [Elusimicrobiota bacterium]